MSSFKVVYRIDPLSPLDLVPRVTYEKPSVEASNAVEEIQKLHEHARDESENSTSYQVQANKQKKSIIFQSGDLVWIHLRKEHFPSKKEQANAKGWWTF